MDRLEPKGDSRFVTRDRVLMALSGIALLVLSGFALYDFLMPEWKFYQRDFRTAVEETLGPEKAALAPKGLQQIWVEALNRVDRCTTCHLGVEWKGLQRAAHPYRSHPKEVLAKHPIQKFGCTLCHGGQGYAVETADAHGLVKFWEEPVLGRELEDFYVMSDKKALLQMNCNTCHRFEKETKGVGLINHAKKLVGEKGCRACHTINGRGATLAPDLTFVGDKSTEQYDYSRIQGMATVFSWHVAHFKNPKEIVAETIMPNFGFSTRDAQALTMLALSWKRLELPVEYLPGIHLKEVPTAEELEKEKQMREGPEAFFVEKTCFVCHSVSAFGIEAAAQIGPDLTFAVEDVQKRFGRTLDDFLHAPTGTMSVVLSKQIMLTEEELEEAIRLLRLAYEKRPAARQ